MNDLIRFTETEPAYAITFSQIGAKKKESEKLAEQIAAFEASGGKIEKIQSGESTFYRVMEDKVNNNLLFNSPVFDGKSWRGGAIILMESGRYMVKLGKKLAYCDKLEQAEKKFEKWKALEIKNAAK